MSVNRPVILLLIAIIFDFVPGAFAQTPTPTPPPSYTPGPTPYPMLTAPASAQTSYTLPVFNTAARWVRAGGSIQAAVNQATPGDRIVLNAESFTESVLTTKTLL